MLRDIPRIGFGGGGAFYFQIGEAGNFRKLIGKVIRSCFVLAPF